ncbi:MAG: hypothetical protein MI921_09370 [Cytophagales bacterium]|nr:hypothetical protein [Cytophagales bacterium]
MKKVVTTLIQMPEIKKVIFNCDVHPHLMTVHSRKLLRVSIVLDEIKKAGFRAYQRV